MKTLLDTCVISELYLPNCHPGVREAYERLRPDDIFLSVITPGEVASGIALLQAGRRKTNLKDWLTGLEGEFSDRLLPVNKEIAMI